jgi:hypothetical protein
VAMRKSVFKLSFIADTSIAIYYLPLPIFDSFYIIAIESKAIWVLETPFSFFNSFLEISSEGPLRCDQSSFSLKSILLIKSSLINKMIVIYLPW